MRNQSTREEYQALLTLRYILDLSQTEWHPSDQPDLMNYSASWGIEVVRDLYPREQESLQHLQTVYNLPFSEWPAKKTKILSKNNVALNIANDSLQSASLPTTPNNPTNTIKTIMRKIDLLNKKNYCALSRYDLFVFVDTTCIDKNYASYVTQIMEEVAAYQNNRELKYDMIYLAHDHVLCICDLTQGTFEHRLISADLRSEINRELSQAGYQH